MPWMKSKVLYHETELYQVMVGGPHRRKWRRKCWGQYVRLCRTRPGPTSQRQLFLCQRCRVPTVLPVSTILSLQLFVRHVCGCACLTIDRLRCDCVASMWRVYLWLGWADRTDTAIAKHTETCGCESVARCGGKCYESVAKHTTGNVKKQSFFCVAKYCESVTFESTGRVAKSVDKCCGVLRKF